MIKSHFGLDALGLKDTPQKWNQHPAELFEEALKRDEGKLTAGGNFLAITLPFTGRSPKDRFIVRDAVNEAQVWWGPHNNPIAPDNYAALKADVLAYLSDRQLFVRDCYACADPRYRLKVRVVSESAWHTLFINNLFIRPPAAELQDFVPDLTILHAPELQADPARHGTKSSTAIEVNVAERTIVIAGTRYAGELKKSVFGTLNYLLPEGGIFPMHCSANVGPEGDMALFFGLSGTGKTTLSADPERGLIGDDEHGWSDQGVFNFEGGCYAKVINLSPEAEPEIHSTLGKFGTVLENVKMDPRTRELDLASQEITENTRAAYPIDFIPNSVPSGVGGHPKNILFLSADAFGVLPPISKLSPEQAMFYFLSGYTAKLAGTERGVTEPQATFSACFGAPFMVRHPRVYAQLLGEKLARHDVTCWLINTGWSGGPYGIGRRMKIAHTRAMVRATLSGSLAGLPTETDPIFGLAIPTACPGVPSGVLFPRDSWADKDAYDAKARDLARRFLENFDSLGQADGAIRNAGPKVQAAVNA